MSMAIAFKLRAFLYRRLRKGVTAAISSAIPAGASHSGVLNESCPLIGESNVKGGGGLDGLGAEFSENSTSAPHLTGSDLASCGLAGIAVDFIKCDIEGAELFMLQGAQKTIDAFKPVILIELYEEWCNKCGYSSKDVITLLTSKGYEIFQAIDGKLKKINSTELLDNERYNYFFLNKTKHSELIKKHC
jgi:hypothetical protein